MYKVKLSDNAIIDLNSIYNFISNDNKFFAVKVIQYIRNTIDYLEYFPFLWTDLDNNLRRLVDSKYKYNIIYKINWNIIEIVSVFKYSDF